MPKIIHISDLHFGKNFSTALWSQARASIVAARPSIILATGDFADNPCPLALLAAKAELLRLCKECTQDTELLVTPGNHDVAEFGNIVNPFRPGWFDLIMFENVQKATEAIQATVGFEIGFNDETLGLVTKFSRYRLTARAALKKHRTRKCDARKQSCAFRGSARRWPTVVVHDNVTIACFNTNPATTSFATGEVDSDQLTRLSTESAIRRQCPDCSVTTEISELSNSSISPTLPVSILKIAALHHHPIPISLAKESRVARGKAGKLEPFLVLTNSGDLLDKLQNDQFDLVLHGHKHRPQIALADFHAGEVDSYPITVVAAGSCAKGNETPDCNIVRLIETGKSGRTTLETISTETGESESYIEPIDAFKRRAFNRAQERTGRMIRELHWHLRIDGVGNLRTVTRWIGLKALKKGKQIDGFPHVTVIPSHGERIKDFIKCEKDCSDWVKLKWQKPDGTVEPWDDSGDSVGGGCWASLEIPIVPGGSEAPSIGIVETQANSMYMTKWELDERKPSDAPYNDREFVWRYISQPIRRLVIHLEVPEEMIGTTPTVCCLRHKNFPFYPLTHESVAQIQSLSHSDFIVDTELQAEEAKCLSFDASIRRWTLDVERPVAGYIYELLWPLPTVRASTTVSGKTREAQRLLINLGRELSSGVHPPLPQKCFNIFCERVTQMLERFKENGNSLEKQAVFLMVYDSERKLMVPSLCEPYIPDYTDGRFDVPFGRGVSGFAFLHRKVTSWTDGAVSEDLTKPVIFPIFEPRHILALPIFHQHKDGDGKAVRVAEPGATIGVLAVSSSVFGSGLAECWGAGLAAQRASQDVQHIAQGIVFEILTVLAQGE